MNSLMLTEDTIKDKIYTLRGVQVMLDSDLAELYRVETKVLNQAVQRNLERFPEQFMFKLTNHESDSLRSQFVTSKGGRRYLPYAFTEQGVAMLSGVLKSDVAVKISIQIMTAFVSMRRFIASNAQVFQRLDNIDQKHIGYDKKFEKIFDAIESKDIKPKQGIFFEGQIFDAYKFVSDLVRNASKSIVLVDNYIDDSVLTLFSKRKKDVRVTMFTNNITKQLELDLLKFNSQYGSIVINKFEYSHDRFMIVDNKEVYHFGASLKDLGKKWFAFSKFDKEAFTLLERLKIN